jgi:hypothetical protein
VAEADGSGSAVAGITGTGVAGGVGCGVGFTTTTFGAREPGALLFALAVVSAVGGELSFVTTGCESGMTESRGRGICGGSIDGDRSFPLCVQTTFSGSKSQIILPTDEVDVERRTRGRDSCSSEELADSDDIVETTEGDRSRGWRLMPRTTSKKKLDQIAGKSNATSRS